MGVRLGIDFDNTIAAYDALFARLAVEEGYLHEEPAGGKTGVRESVRAAAGEGAWRRLQALAYGPRIAGAVLMPGAGEFLSRCRQQAVPVAIVSHKSRRPADQSVDTDLRQAALGWMREQRFFTADGFAIDSQDVHFEDSRAAKVERIAALGLDAFIDDLVEVFAEPGFPAGVRRCLLADDRTAEAGVPLPVEVFHSWNEINHVLLGAD
ncbi:MAG: hypothetical protein CMM08_10690 [Rhodospirillaceae bacterium]|nr:hypothetical protein [Rhodospirillaceae bacterium]